MAVTSNTIANQALQLIGDNAPTVGGQNPTWDGSTAGQALAELYSGVVATVARQWGWDLARNTVALTTTGNTPTNPAYSIEYAYPPNGIEVWQLMPAALSDPNNPLPVNWNVANNLVSGVQTKVIQCNLAGALAVYNNNPNESTWDSLFREAVVRLLSSELSMALFGRPDSAEAYLQSGAAFESIGESRPD
jgi:hypothetical protein